MLAENDLTGQPPSDDDIAEAREVLTRALVKHIALVPPVLAIQLPNLIRCLDELAERRAAPAGPSLKIINGSYEVRDGRAWIEVDLSEFPGYDGAAAGPAVIDHGAVEALRELDPDPTTLILDVETTGVNKDKDEIVELCIQFGFDTAEGLAPNETFLVKPSIPIPAEASKIHGITDEHVKDSPSFAELTAWLTYQFDQAQVIVGYNVHFDLEMITAAFRRAKATPPDFSKIVIIDAYHLWRAMEPRSLADAHQIFLGTKMEQAHEAAADVRATGRIALAMLERYGFLGKEWSEIQLAIDPDRQTWLGPTKHIVWRQGRVVFNFGKNSGAPVIGTDPGFFEWVLKKDFPAHVKTICKAALAVVRKQRTAAQFAQWCASQWPPPVVEPE